MMTPTVTELERNGCSVEQTILRHAAAAIVATAELHKANKRSPYDVRRSFGRLTWTVHSPAAIADEFRTRAGAELAARELNAGRATVDPHLPIGSRVIPEVQ